MNFRPSLTFPFPSPLFCKNTTPAFSITCALSKKQDSPQSLSHQCLAHSFARTGGMGGASHPLLKSYWRVAAITRLDSHHQPDTPVTLTSPPSPIPSIACAQFPSEGGGGCPHPPQPSSLTLTSAQSPVPRPRAQLTPDYQPPTAPYSILSTHCSLSKCYHGFLTLGRPL